MSWLVDRHCRYQLFRRYETNHSTPPWAYSELRREKQSQDYEQSITSIRRRDEG